VQAIVKKSFQSANSCLILRIRSVLIPEVVSYAAREAFQMNGKYGLFFCFIFLSSILFAQSQDFNFDHLSVDQGLSNNLVKSIVQDYRGFMWFGTEDGLNKYDGYTFTVYRHDPDDSLSISGNWVCSLHESHYRGKHILWVGTFYGGLNRLDLDTEQFTHFRHDPNDPQSLSHDRIVSIFEDSFGELWIGTDKGVNKFDRDTGKFVRYQHNRKDPTSLSDNQFCTLYESFTSGTSVLWVGTFKGLNKFDRKTEKFTRYKHDLHNPNSLSHNLICDLFADTSGILWISTNNGGLNKFDIETGQFTHFKYNPDNSNSISSNMVVSILEDNFQGNNVIWLGTFNGLDKFDLKTEQFTHYKHNPGNPKSLCNSRVNLLYKDKTGCIWISTQGGGLSKFDPNRQKFAHIEQDKRNLKGLSGNGICAIRESKYCGPNTFWIGTQEGGLNKYDRNTERFTHYQYDPGNANSLSNDFVLTIFESHFQGRNDLWIGTVDGLNKFDLKTKKFTRYRHVSGDPYSISNNIIRSIYEDQTGTLWVGTRNGGLNKLDRISGRFSINRYIRGEVLAIIEDNTGSLWAGTYRGLAHYNSDTDDYTHYLHDPDDPHSLSHSYVLSLYQDKSARIWIGTRDGLNLYNFETNKFTCYKVKDGLPNNVINGILEDNHGNLWLSTNHGLSVFDPAKKTFRNYDMYDGLQSDQFVIGSCCLSKKGEMLFGGINGFNVFHPDSIRDNPHIPEVYLTDFQIFNKKVDVKSGDISTRDDTYYLPKHISNISEITLSYKESVFSFEFAALDYHSPQKNKYAYKMEGVDLDWVYTDASRRYVTYTQLDPGEYIFHVKASNNDGIWNEVGTSINILITPPWWRTTWAYSVYVLLFAFTLYTLRAYDQKRQRLKHNLELEHLHAEKLEEVDRIKSRFFANISHEFRTPLTLIKGPVKQMLSGEFTGNIKENYQMILRNSDRLLGLINQLLDLSKLESGRMALQVSKTDLATFIKSLVLSFSSLAETRKINLSFHADENTIPGYTDRDKMEKIINNLLSNAFKFTPSRGQIRVTVKIQNSKHQNTNKFQITNYQLPITNSNFLEITVSNTGPAIPADQLGRIFDRFYQADTTYKKDGQGSGIGLALTKELVELHHGTIHATCMGMVRHAHPVTPVDSETTFTIHLPISKDHYKAEEIIEAPMVEEIEFRFPPEEGGLKGVFKEPSLIIHESSIEHRASSIPDKKCLFPVDLSGPNPPRFGPPPVPGLRTPLLLIVEDNADVSSYICSFLNHDYRILSTINGNEGVKKALECYPDLIISDVMMPEMDGFELCKKIKSDEHTSHIPVILLTAKADINSKIEGLEFGADDYISKPFEAGELQARIKNLIEQRKRLQEKYSHVLEINPADLAATSIDEQFIKRLLEVFENHVEESDFSTEDYAREVGMSRSNLHRKLQALTNQPTHQFLRSLRLKRAAQLLKNSTGSVTEIAYAVGFNNPNYFAKMFRQQFGQSPSQFANKNK
jgi:signal transduction histidine kinase/ligand-binding sensor domain-containing protein/DNA-binding response OmpR family regulator